MANKYKPFGVDLDPKGDLKEKNLPDGDIHATIKGEKVPYENHRWTFPSNKLG